MNETAELPLEIISLIIGQIGPKDLYTCTLVNRLFYGLANPLLWRSPRLDSSTIANRFLHSLETSSRKRRVTVAKPIELLDLSASALFWTNDRLVRLLNHSGGSVTALQLPNTKYIDGGAVRQLAQRCSQLRTLTIDYDEVIDSPSPHHLSSLDLGPDHGEAYFLDPLYSPPPHHLSSLNLGPDRGEAYFLDQFYRPSTHHLSSLDLGPDHGEAYCLHPSYLPPGVPMSWGTFSSIGQCTLLTKLVVNISYSMSMDSRRLVKPAFNALMNLRQLTDLRIYSAPKYLARSLLKAAAAGTAWPHLTRFSLEATDKELPRSQPVMADSMIQFLQSKAGGGGGGLKHVGLFNIRMDDAMLYTFAVCFSSTLTSLAISYNFRLTTVGIRRIVLQCPLLTCLQMETLGGGLDGFKAVDKGEMVDWFFPEWPCSRRLIGLDRDTIDRIRLASSDTGGENNNKNDGSKDK